MKNKSLFGDQFSATDFALGVAEDLEKFLYERGLIGNVSDVVRLEETVRNIVDCIEIQEA